MKYTVRVRGSVQVGEWPLDDVMEGRAGESIGRAIGAFRRRYEIDADSTQEAAHTVRDIVAADDTIDELWVSHPDGGADVFDRQAVFSVTRKRCEVDTGAREIAISPASLMNPNRHSCPRRERDILERAVQTISEQAAASSAIVDEAHNTGLDGSHPVTLQAKMLRLELLNVKADLERES